MNKVQKHFDRIAGSYDNGKRKYGYYYSSIKLLLSALIPKYKSVLEVGCGTGDLLVSLAPKNGYGYDLSNEMIKIASKKHVLLGGHRNIKFSTLYPKRKFEYIFMTDVVEHLTNPKEEFKKILGLMDKNSFFINTMANPIWEPLLMFWERQKWKMEEGPHNRIEYVKLKKILKGLGFKIVQHDYKLLMPIYIPFITEFINKHLEPYFKKYAFIEYFVAKKV